MQLARHGHQRYFQPVIAPTDIARMSLDERLQAMDMLWQSLAATPGEIKSPRWHSDVLADRLASVESGQARFLTLAEAKARLAKR